MIYSDFYIFKLNKIELVVVDVGVHGSPLDSFKGNHIKGTLRLT
jgi:hypothetical protein